VAVFQKSHKMKLLLLIPLLTVCSAIHDSFLNVESFLGFSVYRVNPKTKSEAAFLQRLREESIDYDFWTEVRLDRPVDIMVPPKNSLPQKLDNEGLEYELMIPDVQKLIEMEKRATPDYSMESGHAMTWDAYHPLEDMYSYLDYLETTYDHVSTEVIGQTYEKRDMRVVSICKGGCGNKPAVWIDGGIHAREWVSPATVTWMLKELVENDEAHADLLEQADFYILPSVNPDGYAFTQTNNRMWRKTRSDHGSFLGCKGVDANRNWGYHFADGGSSNDKCSDTYHGPEAFSEIENANIRDYIMSREGKFIFFNTIHSYSQLVLLPWGFTTSPPDDYDQMFALAMKGADALTAVHGETYEVGCIPCLLYPASGGSLDWAKDFGIEFSIGMELRDTGHYGFVLPPEQIIPTAEETWAFHLTVIREILATL